MFGEILGDLDFPASGAGRKMFRVRAAEEIRGPEKDTHIYVVKLLLRSSQVRSPHPEGSPTN
jgi:hypothetical protein